MRLPQVTVRSLLFFVHSSLLTSRQSKEAAAVASVGDENVPEAVEWIEAGSIDHKAEYSYHERYRRPVMRRRECRPEEVGSRENDATQFNAGVQLTRGMHFNWRESVAAAGVASVKRVSIQDRYQPSPFVHKIHMDIGTTSDVSRIEIVAVFLQHLM